MSSQITNSVPSIQTFVNSTLINHSSNVLTSVTNTINKHKSININGKKNYHLDTSSNGI